MSGESNTLKERAKNALQKLYPFFAYFIGLLLLINTPVFGVVFLALTLMLNPKVSEYTSKVALLSKISGQPKTIYWSSLLVFIVAASIGNPREADNQRKTTNTEAPAKASVVSEATRVSTPKPPSVPTDPADFQSNLAHNLENLGILLKCPTTKGKGETVYVAITKHIEDAEDETIGTSDGEPLLLMFPDLLTLGSPPKTRIKANWVAGFIFYWGRDGLADNIQFGAREVQRSESAIYLRELTAFHLTDYVGGKGGHYDGFTIDRQSGALRIFTKFTNSYYNCSPMADDKKTQTFTNLYRAQHGMATSYIEKLRVQKEKDLANQKF